MIETYTAPNVSNADLTPSFVRDELLRCFESANQQFFEILGQLAPESVQYPPAT